MLGIDGAEIHEFHGDPGEDDVGWSIADLGDVDLDGFADVAVGKLGNLTGNGWVRVHAGKTGGLIQVINNQFATDGRFAQDIANAGDVDLDGVCDLIVGIPFGGGLEVTGLARVFSPVSGQALLDLPGQYDHGYLGWSVSGIGDINGDGIADQLAGAPDGIAFPFTTTPSATAFSGKDGTPIFTLFGESEEGFGYRVADAGDVNGDGKPDVVVGAINDSELAYKAGGAFVYTGVQLPLTVSDYAVAYPEGGSATMRLRAGPDHGGQTYVLLGSLSGASPGTQLGTTLLPLNLDAYLLHTANHLGAAPLSGSFGTLSPSGVATAQFTAPAGLPPSYQGLTFHHAFVTVDPVTGAIPFASNAVPISLVAPSDLH